MQSRLILFLLSGLLTLQAAAADPLVIYSGRSDKFVKPVVEAFEKETGIEVLVHAGGSTALLNKLKLEGKRTDADLYISNDAGNLQKGSEMKLFRPVPEEIAGQIPANFRAPDNTWLGLSARARMLVANSEQSQTDFVDSVFDLADPRLKGKLAITHSGNESYIAGVTVYMLAAGKEVTRDWLQGMKENVGGSVFNKHSKIVNAVADGKKAIGLVNHYYIYRHLDQYPDAPLKVIPPDQGEDGMGVAWNVAGIAMSRHSQKSEAAEKFLDFVVSEKGQKMFAEVNREYPTRPGVPAADEVPPLDSYKVADVPMARLGEQRNATLDLIEQVGMP
ncbi:extracellular solute-binding protein [Thiohalophilus thiocyanatoxydans]|uniref:Iron(III) transport system substrate-binding protein n=1 Tax=Thiohalophilus thiocyanatoxydans TaxID=381308 RepID=A0A4R8J343_9GAMM|nr:extracellular solute-binding protein [Thiohalophilus thiocyanatoxydans]TDY04293.1 iron(III) transport system substrate-binding protein [Thiohalophilus thiocyanatoxydans]